MGGGTGIMQGFIQRFWEKMIDITAKLGEINDIEHNKGSKIYPQNQVIVDCIMPTIPLKHKCLSSILTWVIVSVSAGLKIKKNVFEISINFR